MRSRLLLKWIGLAMSFALLVAVAALPAPGQSPQPKGTEPHEAKAVASRKKHPRVPLQRNLELATKSNNEFRNPPECPSSDPCELILRKDTFEFPGASLQSAPDAEVPQKFELLCYNTYRFPVGPTIRVRPGTTFKIHVKNDLKCGKTDPGASKYDPPTFEKPHGLCTTNLHTHGLHVSPKDPSDNILRLIEPGADWTFSYDLRADHPSGSFWYHPHKHGSVAYQLSNGLAGALIVERDKKKEKNKEGDAVRYLEDIYEIASAEEKVMVLQYYTYRVGADDIARIDAQLVYNILPDAKSCEEITVTDKVPSVTGQATAINGMLVPTIKMAPGEVQRWRIIHGSWDELKPLTFADKADNKTTDLLFREIAVDGLATGGMTLPEDNTLELAPGQRSDVLIQAPMIPAGQTAVYFLKQDGVPPAKTTRGLPTDPLFLAKIVVTGPPKPMSLPDPKLVAKCRALDDIKDYELSPTTAAFKDGIYFNGIDLNKTYNIGFRTFHGYSDQKGQMQPVPIAFGTAQEWTVKAAPTVNDDYDPTNPGNPYPNNHPFHIHVNPFQVVMYTDANGNSKPMNVWRDTLLIKGGESYTIRSRFLDYKGTTVLHCHILDHEDQGMMVPLTIDDPSPAATKASPRASLEPAAIPAPMLTLPDVGGAIRELAAFRRRNVVLVFFQGVQCSHCASQLRDLVRDARGKIGPDAEIVAVSGRPIADTALALKVLGVTASDRFHLLVNRDHRAFRDFGCYDGEPKHGLFLIDQAGMIRFRYVGEAPFDDPRQVVERLRRLVAVNR